MKNFLMTLIVVAVALANTLSVTGPATETSSVEGIVVPSETPAEVPTEVPAEAPAEASTEAADEARTILATPIALSELCPGVETQTLDFGDFTLSLPADTYGQQGAKTNGQAMLLLYETLPTGTEVTANLNAVWVAQSATYSEELAASMAEELEKSYPTIIAQLQMQGIAASNMRLLSAATGSVGNLPSVDLLTSYDADYTALGVDLKTNLLMLQRTVCLGDKGMYIFTITAEDLSECVRLSSILNTLAWKE